MKHFHHQTADRESDELPPPSPPPRFRLLRIMLAGMLVWLVMTSFFAFFLDERERTQQSRVAAAVLRQPAGEAAAPPPMLAQHRFESGMVIEVSGIILMLLLVMVWANPVRSWFRALARGRSPDPGRLPLVRRRLRRSALVVGLWLPLALLLYKVVWVGLAYFVLHDLPGVERDLGVMPDRILVAALSGLFMFLWQHHLIQRSYLRHVFSPDEFHGSMPAGRPYSIRINLILMILLASVLPLGVVTRFIGSGMTPVQSLSTLTDSQRSLLFSEIAQASQAAGAETAGAAAAQATDAASPVSPGSPGHMAAGLGMANELVRRLTQDRFTLVYMDALNSMRLLTGLVIGLLILIPYSIAIIRWTAVDLVTQVEDLRRAMQRVGRGRMDAFTPVLSNNELGELALGFNTMLKGLEERNRIKGLFGQYLTSEVSEAILDGRVDPDGDQYEATIMFTDIRSFTAMSETMEPREVFTFLNEYLDQMIEVIVAKGGFIDKFIGDGILCVFGVPIRNENHALIAMETAAAMRVRLGELNRARTALGKPPIAIGSGIHTGPVIAGEVGNERKKQYTVIGDTVNLASRLEGLNKDYGSTIVVSQTTWDALPDGIRGSIAATRLPGVEIRGKREAITVWRID